MSNMYMCIVVSRKKRKLIVYYIIIICMMIHLAYFTYYHLIIHLLRLEFLSITAFNRSAANFISFAYCITLNIDFKYTYYFCNNNNKKNCI